MQFEDAVAIMRDAQAGQPHRMNTHAEARGCISGYLQEREAPPKTWIYFVLREPDAIKIGTASDPRARLKNLQVGSPQPLALLGCYWGYTFEEKQLHDRFAEHRIGGEWFRPHPDLVDYIAPLCALSEWHWEVLPGQEKEAVLREMEA